MCWHVTKEGHARTYPRTHTHPHTETPFSLHQSAPNQTITHPFFPGVLGGSSQDGRKWLGSPPFIAAMEFKPFGSGVPRCPLTITNGYQPRLRPSWEKNPPSGGRAWTGTDQGMGCWYKIAVLTSKWKQMPRLSAMNSLLPARSRPELMIGGGFQILFTSQFMEYLPTNLP